MTTDVPAPNLSPNRTDAPSVPVSTAERSVWAVTPGGISMSGVAQGEEASGTSSPRAARRADGVAHVAGKQDGQPIGGWNPLTQGTRGNKKEAADSFIVEITVLCRVATKIDRKCQSPTPPESETNPAPAELSSTPPSLFTNVPQSLCFRTKRLVCLFLD